MRPTSIVMADPLPKDPSQVTSVEGDEIVQTFAAYSSNQSFAMSVGRWRTNRRSQDVYAPVLNFFIQTGRESLVSIMKKELVILIAGKLYSELLQGPVSRGVFGHIEMNQRVRQIRKGYGSSRWRTRRSRKLRSRAHDCGERLTSADP
jgi:hypothetical protein